MATLRWDVGEAKRRFSLAIPLGDPVLARYDYASALTFLGHADEAFDALQAAFDRAPDNLTVLRRLIEATLFAARFTNALSLCAVWDKLSPAKGHAASRDHRSTGGSLGTRSFHRERRPEHPTLRFHRETGSRQARLVEAHVKPSVAEPGTFFANLRVIGSPEQAADLNEALAGRWADSTALMNDPGLRFIPMLLCRTPDGNHA